MDAYNTIIKIEPDNAEAKAGLDNVVATINTQSSGEVDQERQVRSHMAPHLERARVANRLYRPMPSFEALHD